MARVRIKKLHPKATIPRYQTRGAAGLDLHAALDEAIVLRPGERRLVPTGLAIGIESGYEGQVRPRSGLALRHGISCVNSPGTIDSDYTGPANIILINHGSEDFEIRHGDRIAQLVIAPVVQAELVEVDELEPTERGSGGFGSTGR